MRSGIRSIEHGFLDDEAIAPMLEHGTWLVPTLVAPLGVIRAAKAGAALPEEMVCKAEEVVEVHADSVRRAVAAGVRIAMGTDAGAVPHGDNLEELSLMRESGMTSQQVLAATTSSAADPLGLGEQIGRLAPGYRADLVLVDGDAFDFASQRSNVRQVWRDGVRMV